MPRLIADQLELCQKQFLWDGKRAKIKHKTLIGPYEKGGLKSVNIDSKVSALQLYWIKRLYDNNTHPWKLIPKYLFKKHFGYE